MAWVPRRSPEGPQRSGALQPVPEHRDGFPVPGMGPRSCPAPPWGLGPDVALLGVPTLDTSRFSPFSAWLVAQRDRPAVRPRCRRRRRFISPHGRVTSHGAHAQLLHPAIDRRPVGLVRVGPTPPGAGSPRVWRGGGDSPSSSRGGRTVCGRCPDSGRDTELRPRRCHLQDERGTDREPRYTRGRRGRRPCRWPRGTPPSPSLPGKQSFMSKEMKQSQQQ